MTTPTWPDGPADIVVQPTPPQWRFGLLSAATLIDVDAIRNPATWTDDTCSPSVDYDPNCPTEPRPDKAFPEGLLWGDAEPFALINALSCQRLGLDNERTRVETRFAFGEQAGIERNVYRRFRPRAVLPLGTDPVPLLDGLGALEKAAALASGAQAIIHASRDLSPHLGDRHIIREGPVLTTNVGTVWAFGAGYDGLSPTGETPAAGTGWLYATGQVVIERAPLVISESFDRRTNLVQIVAERTYRARVSCPVIGVHVTVSDQPAP